MSNSKYTQVLPGLLSLVLPEKYISRGALYYIPIHITSFRNNVWKSSSFPRKFMAEYAKSRVRGFFKTASCLVFFARVDVVYK